MSFGGVKVGHVPNFPYPQNENPTKKMHINIVITCEVRLEPRTPHPVKGPWLEPITPLRYVSIWFLHTPTFLQITNVLAKPRPTGGVGLVSLLTVDPGKTQQQFLQNPISRVELKSVPIGVNWGPNR